MTQFRPQVSRIKGLSDKRRMPLLGKIRLGIKKKSERTGNEYPVEVDYFVCPDEVRAVYGDQPKALRIMVPLNDIEAVFPTAYCFYGSGKGVKCKGDGEIAWAVNDNGEMETRPCPCELLEAGKCKQVGRFLFMLPEVSVGGVYQLTTSSFNSIVDIQSGLDFVQAMVGRFSMIELCMKREPTETHHDGKKQTHFTVKLTLPTGFNVQSLVAMRQDQQMLFTAANLALPEPVEDNPEYDPPDVITDEEDGPPDAPPPADWLDGMGENNPPADDPAGIDEEKITPAQLKKMAALLTKLNYKERDARMALINSWLEANDKPAVESSKDLTKKEASNIIDALEKESKAL